MIIIFIGGHGRCDESLLCNVPAKIALTWYGCQGNSVGKDFSNAVLNGTYTCPLPTGMVTTPVCEHYLCESVGWESDMRVDEFQKGPWDTNTFLIQARPELKQEQPTEQPTLMQKGLDLSQQPPDLTEELPERIVPLSAILDYATNKWEGQLIEIRWAVCRTSVRYKSSTVHHFNEKTKTPYNEILSPKNSAKIPSKITSRSLSVTEFEEHILLDQWGNKRKNILHDKKIIKKQIENIFGKVTSNQIGKFGESPI